MPNWCSTTVTLNVDSHEKACKMAKYLEELNTRTAYDSSKGWLGIIPADLGFSKEQIDKMGTRGFINTVIFDEDTDTITIYIDDAWCPHLDPIRLYCMHMGDDDIRFSYVAEECGCELYEYYGDEWYTESIDVYVPENEYFHETYDCWTTGSEEETMEILASIVKFPFDSIKDCVEKANKRLEGSGHNGYDDYFFVVNSFNEVSPEDIGMSGDKLREMLKKNN